MSFTNVDIKAGICFSLLVQDAHNMSSQTASIIKLHMESMGMGHLTFVTMHLVLLKVVFAQVFTLYKIQLGKYLLQISYTHFEPTNHHSTRSVSTLTKNE
jgi:hypothetical protein